MKRTGIFFLLLVGMTATGGFTQTINNVGPLYFPSPFYPFNSQLQTAQDNVLMLQANNVGGANPLRDNLRLGIGVFPGAPPVDRVHVNTINAANLNIRLTNLVTGSTAADGFVTGILNTGDAILNQMENLPMRFNTNAVERMRILPNGFVGINTAAPTNQFEVNSSLGGCTSGMRLTQLNAGCVPIVNPGGGVLAVDAAGNVIYVAAGAGPIIGANNGLSVLGGQVQLGGNCGSGLGALFNNRQIPMNTFNLELTMGAGSPSQLNVGFPGCAGGAGRVNVTNDFHTSAGVFSSFLGSGGTVVGSIFRSVNNGGGTAHGITTTAFATGGGANAIAVDASSLGGPGVFFSQFNMGLNALTSNGTVASMSVNADVINSNSPQNTGVQSDVTGNITAGALNIGGDFNVSGNAAGSINIGIFSNVPTAFTGGAGPDWAGFFNGEVFSTGGYFPSDRNLKKDIRPIENSLDIIKKLNPVNYSFDKANHPDLALPSVNQWGFISQEVEEILPEFTRQTIVPAVYDSLGKAVTAQQEILALNYNGFIAILTKAIQEQQKQIDELKALLQGSSASTLPLESVNSQEVELSDKEYVVLNQNVPNPFAEKTTISYVIPDNAVSTQILFYNAMGQIIKTVEVNDRGYGILNVFADDLSSGIYSYSLIIDGKTIDTKKMIKSR